VVGVAGVVAALTLSAGVVGPTKDPLLFGQNYQKFVEYGASDEDVWAAGSDARTAEAVRDVVAAVPGVADVSDLRVAVARSSDVDVHLHRMDPDHPLPLVLLRGRAPSRPGEVAIAPTTARQLKVGIGDSVAVSGDRGGRDLTVSGIAFVPEGRNHHYESGGWIVAGDYDALFAGFTYHWGLVRYRPGADVATVGAAIDSAMRALHPTTEFWYDPFPTGNEEIGSTRRVPLALAGLLTLLALVAVGHGLVDAIRDRRREIAVMRALGLTPRQTGGLLAVQAALIGLAGVAIGVPLGLATGRLHIAASSVVLYQAPTPELTLTLVLPTVGLTALLLAAWPAYRAARISLGPTLRAE
jgi:hypothetical protein